MVKTVTYIHRKLKKSMTLFFAVLKGFMPLK